MQPALPLLFRTVLAFLLLGSAARAGFDHALLDRRVARAAVAALR